MTKREICIALVIMAISMVSLIGALYMHIIGADTVVYPLSAISFIGIVYSSYYVNSNHEEEKP